MRHYLPYFQWYGVLNLLEIVTRLASIRSRIISFHVGGFLCPIECLLFVVRASTSFYNQLMRILFLGVANTKKIG